MPRGSSPSNVPALPLNSALDNLPADLRADLLRAQSEQVTTFQRLPRLKIMAAGAGLLEFTDTNDTVREVRGVILNSHPRNMLWEPDGARSDDNENAGPACVANDGKFGTPRRGFPHAALNGQQAQGTERIECATCPYNQWGSAGLIDPSRAGTKGKATTNQRVLYLLVEGRESPVELTLSPSSLQNYDGYLMTLGNQQLPIQTVLTVITLETKSRGAQRWSVAKFQNGGVLEADAFTHVMEKRRQYMNSITPQELGATLSESDEAIIGDDEPIF
jgi:hypothetical protein